MWARCLLDATFLLCDTRGSGKRVPWTMHDWHHEGIGKKRFSKFFKTFKDRFSPSGSRGSGFAEQVQVEWRGLSWPC